MEALFLRMLTLSAACGAVLLPLLVLGRRIRHRYAARTMYVLWLLIAVRLILPFQFQIPAPVITVEAPGYTFELPAAPAAPAAPAGQGGAPGAPPAASVGGAPAITPNVPQTPAPTVSLTELLCMVWLAGMAAFLGYQLISYALARRALLRASAPAKAEARGELDSLRGELGIRRAVDLRVTERVTSPVMLGLFRPVVLLPAGEEVPALVLRHELCHLKRLDVGYKGLMLLANAFHWFNPLVWWMAREAGRNLELCCDEAALRGAPADERRVYGEILLRTAAGGASPAFSTRFGSGKKQLRERLSNLFQKKRTGAVLVCSTLVLALALGSLVACESGGEAAAPLSPFDALVELEDSAAFDPETGNLTFVLPAGYAPASDWNIHVAGRQSMGDGGDGMSLHYFEGETWEPGDTAIINLTEGQVKNLTELSLDAALPDPGAEHLGGERSISVDLLALVRAATTLYTDTEYGFTLRLPESWQGKYVTQPDSSGSGTVFRQKSRGANSGNIFTLYTEETAAFRASWGDGSYEEIEARFNGGGMIIFGKTGDYTVYAIFVSDMNYDATREDVAAEYDVMLRDAEAMDRTNFAAAPTAQGNSAAVDRTDLEACIGDAILQTQSWHADNELRTQSHVTLKAEESAAQATAYVMALYQGFLGGQSGFETFQGGMMPVAITFEKNSEGEYRLVDYWQPSDGEGYWSSIRERFPRDIPDGRLDTQNYVEKLTQECYAQAVAYWNIDTAPIIEGLLEAICASPGVTADPDTYPDAARRELRCYGQSTLDYCMEEFEKGGQTGLKGTVMAAVCQELLGAQPDVLTGPGDTGQSWYEAYRLAAAEQALLAQRPDYTLLRMVRHGESFVAAARKNPDDVVGYYAPTAFILARRDGIWSIAAEQGCDPALTPGFSASVLHAEGMTVVVGDLGDRLLLPGPLDEEGMGFRAFEETDVVLVTDGGKWGATFRKDGDILFAVDGTLKVSDLLFSVDGEQVTGYQQIFGEAPEAFDQG